MTDRWLLIPTTKSNVMFGMTLQMDLSFFFFNSNKSHKYFWLEITFNLNQELVIKLSQNLELIKKSNFLTFNLWILTFTTLLLYRSCFASFYQSNISHFNLFFSLVIYEKQLGLWLKSQKLRLKWYPKRTLNRFKSYLRTSTFKENSFQFACGGVNHLSANNIHEKVRESNIGDNRQQKQNAFTRIYPEGGNFRIEIPYLNCLSNCQ